jgi:hypothetical protein
MPDLDGAHGFLTVLLPLHTAPCARADGVITSPAHAVRELLASWPTAQHSPACAASGLQSFFARSLSTHFARLAVIDQPAFNGRTPQNALLTAAQIGPALGVDPAVDDLGRPYLLFCAEFDRGGDAQTAIQNYTTELWSCAPEIWSSLLKHCEGWGEGAGGADFARYLQSCQVETTMPFNDYAVVPGVAARFPAILGPALIAGAVFFAAIAAMRLLCAALPPAAAWTFAILIAVGAAGASAVFAINAAAQRSSPWVEGLDLPTVLKSLDLQARFTRFALDHQTASPSELQRDFRAFLDVAQPKNLADPTQPPGVVRGAGGAL